MILQGIILGFLFFPFYIIQFCLCQSTNTKIWGQMSLPKGCLRENCHPYMDNSQSVGSYFYRKLPTLPTPSTRELPSLHTREWTTLHTRELPTLSTRKLPTLPLCMY